MPIFGAVKGINLSLLTMTELLEQLKNEETNFSGVIAFIENRYQHTPTAFKNGGQLNAADQNQGSAKLLYFAQLHHLSKEDTLALFAEHYQAVLNTPDGNDHQNIRQFMENGWHGVAFEGEVLTEK